MTNMIRAIFILICFFTLAAVIYIFSGTYNIAATVPHSGFVTWIFKTAKISSIRKHAEGIKEPPLNDTGQVKEGFEHYDNMCVGCHGGPGIEGAKVFNPAPPDLAKVVELLKPAEIFWVIKNGIKMTGMPESGSTHSDEDIWGMVAFIKRLPQLSPEQYKLMRKEAEKNPHSHDHHDEDHE
ncbi:MAG: c-type cytochrome [Thermodesulfobacteriota bacterium]